MFGRPDSDDSEDDTPTPSHSRRGVQSAFQDDRIDRMARAAGSHEVGRLYRGGSFQKLAPTTTSFVTRTPVETISHRVEQSVSSPGSKRGGAGHTRRHGQHGSRTRSGSGSGSNSGSDRGHGTHGSHHSHHHHHHNRRQHQHRQGRSSSDASSSTSASSSASSSPKDEEMSSREMIGRIDQQRQLTDAVERRKRATVDDDEEEQLRSAGLKTHSEMRMDMLSRGITPEFEPTFRKHPRRRIRPLNLDDPRTFLMTPAPKEHEMIKCFIDRQLKAGLLIRSLKHRVPKYFLHHEESGKFLLAGKRRFRTHGSQYVFCLSRDHLNRNSADYFGKLRGNVAGTEFLMYDKGESVENGPLREGQHVRHMLGGVKFEKALLGSKTGRVFTVLLPRVGEGDVPVRFPEDFGAKSLIQVWMDSEWDDLMIVKNKIPPWDATLGAHVLNFERRVTQASIKNFQVVDPKHPDTILVQFGRVDEDRFVLDYRWPFSAFQAFCVALTVCDPKLMAE